MLPAFGWQPGAGRYKPAKDVFVPFPRPAAGQLEPAYTDEGLG